MNGSHPPAASVGRKPTYSRRAMITVFGAATIAGVVLSAMVASGRPILASRWSLLWLLAVWAGSWTIAVIAARRLPRRLAVGLILAGAVAIRLAALAGPPTTSDDLYRYAWDGQIQTAGIDPYAYPPSAPQLAGHRHSWLWPDDSGCAALHRAPGCTRINRPSVRTIYPPIAEAWFAAVYRLTSSGARHKPWQIAGLIADLATVGLLTVALTRTGRDPRWLALYALCPAPTLEFVNNGHVDGLAVTLIVAAVVVALRPLGRVSQSGDQGAPPRWATLGRDAAIGVLLGAAILVKVYPAILLVSLVGLPRPRAWLGAARSTAAAALLAAACYLPHILAVGVRIVGYLPGYLKEEHYTQGTRFLLPGAIGLSGWLAGAVALIGVVGTIAWMAWRRPEMPRAATLVLVALFLATTPVQPWYAVSLLALATIAAWPWAAAAALAAYPYFFAVILDYRHTIDLGRTSYATALVFVAATSFVGQRRRRKAHDSGHRSCGNLSSTNAPPVQEPNTQTNSGERQH